MRPYEKRGHQIAKYLDDQFPTPYPVELRFVDKIPLDREAAKTATKREKETGDYGITEWDASKRKIVIKLSRKLCGRNLLYMIETLLHEWAHARTMPNYRVWVRSYEHYHLPHPPLTWGTAYGEIYSRMYDEGGLTESRAY